MNTLNKKTLIGFIILFIPFFVIISSCKKEKKSDPLFTDTGTVTDIDNNVYKTVKIANQWWMTENLKVRRYQNGDSINYVGNLPNSINLDTSLWNNTKIGTYCINNNDSSNKSTSNYLGQKFGFLYNFYAVTDARNIAPAGWHVASDDEWKQLEMHIGMSSDDANKLNYRGSNEGDKLKTTYNMSNYWLPSDEYKYKVWGTNESGFSATAGGCCMFNGIWGEPNIYYTAFWWTSSSVNAQGWYRSIEYDKSNIFRFYGLATYGFSVRCVKD